MNLTYLLICEEVSNIKPFLLAGEVKRSTLLRLTDAGRPNWLLCGRYCSSSPPTTQTRGTSYVYQKETRQTDMLLLHSATPKIGNFCVHLLTSFVTANMNFP